MISSINGNAGWLPPHQAAQVASHEVPGEMENDGDRDDVAATAKAPASGGFPGFMGNRINTLA